jgi:hypothetical protein
MAERRETDPGKLGRARGRGGRRRARRLWASCGAELAGVAEIEGLQDDAESLSQYGPHHGLGTMQVASDIEVGSKTASGI